MLISIIATIISSIALIGVAAGLILQARQIRISQIQAVRSLHLELIKTGIDNPSLVAALVSEDTDPSESEKIAYLNLWVEFWRAGYGMKSMSKASIAFYAQLIFEREYARRWWQTGRDLHYIEVSGKRERDFLDIVDAEFQNAIKGHLENVVKDNS